MLPEDRAGRIAALPRLDKPRPGILQAGGGFPLPGPASARHTLTARNRDMPEQSTAVYLIDGSSYLYRAFFAIRGLTNRDGLPTNAVFGFANMIFRILNERRPTHLAVIFDSKGPTFRNERYADYKAHRPPMPEELARQIPYIHRFLADMHIPVLQIGGVEADDVIATLSTQTEKIGISTVIVSSDKDFYQILSDRISMWDTMKDVTLGPKEIEERFGVPPERVVEVQALVGDASDNIPGVSGVGEKTAVKLIAQYGDLETLLAAAGEIKQPKLRASLVNDAEKARLGKELMRIRCDMDLPVTPEDMHLGKPDTDALSRLFLELDFQRFLDQLHPVEEEPENKHEIVVDEDRLRELVEILKTVEVLSVDTATTSRNPMEAEIAGISLSWKTHRAAYIPVCHTGAEKQIPLETALTILKPVLEAEQPVKIGQNVKYDYVVLKRYGLEMNSIGFDTMVGSYLINPDRYAHSLENMAREFLGEKLITYDDLTGKGKAATFKEVPLDRAAAYGGQEADVVFRLHTILKDALDERKLTPLMDNVEVPLIQVLARMEMWGVKIDFDLLNDMSKEFEGRMSELERSVCLQAGEPFNLNSPKQLGAILFEKLGLPTHKKTAKKTAYSTDTEVMTSLARDYPIAGEVLAYRTLAKLKGTYIDALPRLVNPATGRVHTSYNQTIAATGRLSSSDPNLQNIPIRGEEGRKIRTAFIPEPGWKLISADYSQIELRVLAHYSNDPTLIRAFLEGEDVHTRTASEVFNVNPAFVDPEMRRRAKVINFGIVYGMSGFGLAKELGIGRKEADLYIRNYFARLKGVERFIKENLLLARSDGYVTTLLGRRRYLPEIKSRNKALSNVADRVATNTPIQGSAADIIKLAMVRLMNTMDEQGLRTRMILQVHDELVFEVPEDELDRAGEIIRDGMEHCITLNVPLVVDMKTGNNWAEAH